MNRTARTMTVSAFRTNLSRVLDELGPEGVVLTKRGRAVARVTPAGRATGRDLIGALKGEIKVRGNLVSTGAW
jgi:antitoxin (DNA-binding transcriptional repressor) of toxin-antitoxin stability system